MMPQFFIKSSDIREGRCVIGGDDFCHLTKVRRVRPGDRIEVRSDEGRLVTARIAVIGTDRLEAEILEERFAGAPSLEVALCLALLKGKNFDLAVQKATEVGVSRIIPVVTERAVAVPKKESSGKLERWRRIAAEAAKQCLRSDIPAIDDPRSFGDLMKVPPWDVRIIAHTGAERSFLHRHVPEGRPAVSILVGPEGGFSPREIEDAEAAGWEPLRFGETQLRAETAAIVIPALVINLWG